MKLSKLFFCLFSCLVATSTLADSVNAKYGQWSKKEDELLKAIVLEHPDWTMHEVARDFSNRSSEGTRTVIQCRSHWRKLSHPGKNCQLSNADKAHILKEKQGKPWLSYRKIASEIGSTEDQVKSFFNYYRRSQRKVSSLPKPLKREKPHSPRDNIETKHKKSAQAFGNFEDDGDHDKNTHLLFLQEAEKKELLTPAWLGEELSDEETQESHYLWPREEPFKASDVDMTLALDPDELKKKIKEDKYVEI